MSPSARGTQEPTSVGTSFALSSMAFPAGARDTVTARSSASERLLTSSPFDSIDLRTGVRVPLSRYSLRQISPTRRPSSSHRTIRTRYWV